LVAFKAATWSCLSLRSFSGHRFRSLSPSTTLPATPSGVALFGGRRFRVVGGSVVV
jgi:hypothetical protein